MSAAASGHLTPEQYLALERQAASKSGYFAGEIFAMAGVSKEHNRISGNVFGLLWMQLRDRPCTVYNSDMKVRVTGEHYAYPDVTVVCGDEEFEDEETNVLLNPTLIVEALAPNTEAWDRARKSEQYLQRPSRQECILVAQDRPHLERCARQASGEWMLSEVNGVEAVLSLPSIGCEPPLSQVYRGITLPAAPGPR